MQRHRVIGTAILVVGALLAAVGLALIVILGPDGRFTTGPHPIETHDVAVVTAPTVIAWKNVEVEILAEVPASKPVFVGLANSVDLQAYVKGVKRMEITSFSTPWKLRAREAAGRNALPGAPTAVDWWRAHAAGLGGAHIKTQLPDETVSAAILAVGSTNLRGLKVSIAYGIHGAFFKGLGLLLLGGGLAWGGLLTRRGEHIFEYDGEPDDGLPTWRGDDAPTELIPRIRRVVAPSAGSAAPVAAVAARPLVDEPATRRGPSVEEGVAGAQPVDVEPVTAVDPDDAEGSDEIHEVMYVYVDEDGVEHEISAEEAAQYEVVEVEHIIEEEPEDDDESATVEDVPEADETDERDDADGVGETDERDDADGVGGVEPHPSEPIRYYWVDDDGVEHDVSPDELHEFDHADEDHHERDNDDRENEDRNEGEVAAGHKPVTYFWVDEDGVEHEVSEEELAEFELYDEDES